MTVMSTVQHTTRLVHVPMDSARRVVLGGKPAPTISPRVAVSPLGVKYLRAERDSSKGYKRPTILCCLYSSSHSVQQDNIRQTWQLYLNMTTSSPLACSLHSSMVSFIESRKQRSCIDSLQRGTSVRMMLPTLLRPPSLHAP